MVVIASLHYALGPATCRPALQVVLDVLVLFTCQCSLLATFSSRFFLFALISALHPSPSYPPPATQHDQVFSLCLPCIADRRGCPHHCLPTPAARWTSEISTCSQQSLVAQVTTRMQMSYHHQSTICHWVPAVHDDAPRTSMTLVHITSLQTS